MSCNGVPIFLQTVHDAVFIWTPVGEMRHASDEFATLRAYRFGPFVLDVQERRVLRDGLPVPLTPKVFDTLVYLVERDCRLVGKDELLEAIWGGTYVEEGSLARAVHVLRKTLNAADKDGAPRQYIETIPTKGYRFVGPVTRLGETLPAVASAAPPGNTSTEVKRPLIPARLRVVAALLILTVVGITWRAPARDSRPRVDASRLSSPTNSGAAYARFQSGRLHLERHLPGGAQLALRDFEAALQFDPTFVAAYAGKADAKFLHYWDTGQPDEIVEARLAIRSAFELDGDSSYAHTMQCRLQATYDWEFADAEATCRRAIALDPVNHEARRELAFLLNAGGREDEALKEMDRAVSLAPTSFNKRSRGVLLYFARRFDDAIAQLKQVEATDPEFAETSRWIARAYEQKGQHAQALFIRFRESAGAPPDEPASLRRAFAAGGWRKVLLASLPEGKLSITLDNAGTLAQLGRADAALAVLESMSNARRVMIVHINSEPRLDPIRPDRRFQELADRIVRKHGETSHRYVRAHEPG